MKAAAIALALLCAPSAWAQALTPYIWNDVTGSLDMPWLGRGGRAHYFKRDVTKPWDIMNPRGPTIETRWGASGGTGEDPFQSTDRPNLTPGQVAIAAAAAEEAAEAVTREAESCKVCLDWPGLCASCHRLSLRAVGYRELADQLRRAVPDGTFQHRAPGPPGRPAVPGRGAAR